MNRLFTKILVFGSLIGAAGAAWGVFIAGALGRGNGLDLAIDPPKSNAAWGVPVALVFVIVAVWLAGWVKCRNPWKSAATLHSLHFFLIPYLISASIMTMLADFGESIIFGSLGLYIVGFMVLPIVETMKWRKRRKKLGLPMQRASFKEVAVPIAVFLLISVAIMAGIEMLTPKGSGHNEGRIVSYGGNLAIIFAWLFGNVASIDLPAFLGISLLFGACAGTFGGFTVEGQTYDDKFNQKSVYIGMAAGFFLGALVSGLAFGAQAVQLIHTYDVAAAQSRVFSTALYIWGVCGALVGLLLAGVLHGLTGEKSERPKRMINGLAVAIIPIFFVSYWAFGYVETKDAGRSLFAKADKLEGHGYWVGLGCDLDARLNYQDRNMVIRIANGKPIQSNQNESYSQTIDACEELLSRYPNSAYRAAALLLKSWCQTNNWQSHEALNAWRLLNTEYPNQSICRPWMASLVSSRNYSLLGDYKSVLDSHQIPDFYSSPEKIRAAKALGRWDYVIKSYKKRLSSIDRYIGTFNRRPNPDVAIYKKKIAEVEAMKAKGVGPKPRTDISGKILVNGKPAKGIPVGVILANLLDASDKIQQISTVAACGGLLGETDNQGMYHIRQAPSEKYEIVVVLNPRKFPIKEYRVRTAGIPFNANGKSVTAPTVELY